MERIALVTGTARGIGLEFCRQLLGRDWTVLACPRRSGSDGTALLAAEAPDRLHEIAIDIGSDDSVRAAADAISRRVDHVDLLINNAGIYPKDGGLEQIEPQALLDAFSVNALGPLRVTRALLPLLRRGAAKRIANITSLMGSMGDNSSGGSYAYRISKAALNMATRNLAHELGREGFVVLTLHPGWVQTEMGGPGAPLGLDEACADLLKTILEAGSDENGTFRGPGQRALPW